MKAFWRENERRIESESALWATITAVRASREPTMLFLEDEEGTSLVLGLGSAESVLTFAASDGASYHSVGDRDRTGRLRFWCRDQVDEFMEEMAIPEAVAVEAAVEFYRTRRQPSRVTWEADW